MPTRSRVLQCFLAAATFAALAAPLAAHAAPGDLDTTYGIGGRVIESLGTSVAAVIPVGDGSSLVAGTYTDPSSGISTMWASRRTVTGAPDATFGGANDSWAIVSFATLSCNSVTGTDAVRTGDGALLIAGTCTRGGDRHMAVARLTPAGVPDPGFGTDGRVLLEFSDDPTDLSSEANAIALTHDGAHALVGGQASTSYAASGDASVRSMALVQIDAVTGAVASLTGQDRRTYPFAGVGNAKRPSRIEDLVVNSDGTIAATGQVEQPFARGVLRLLGGGDYDPRFGGEAPLSVGQATYGYGTSDYAQGIAVLPNGSMVVAGSTESRPRLSVVSPSGATHFAEAASTTPGASTAVELDDSGRQYVTGWRFEGGMRAFVERRSADGSLAFDASFGGAGRVDLGFPGAAVGTALALDGNRGLLVGGFTIDDQSRQTAVLARLLTADATVAPDPQTPVTPPTTSPPPPIQRVVTDTVAPIVTVTDPVGGAVRRSGEWNFAGAADPTGTPLVRVYLYRSGAATAMAELPTSTGSSTRWSIAGPHGQVLADGTYELEAVQVDAAGNVGRSGRVKFRVDLPRKKPTNPSTMKVVGRFAVDQVIGVTSSSPWSPATGVSLSYRWERCRSAASVTCAAIPGSFARSATYQLEAADAARWVRVLVTARTEAGATVKTSATAGPITAEPRRPRLASGHPLIEGRAAVGQTLTARTGTWTGIPAPNVSVSWQRCTYFGVCRQVSTGGSYRIQEPDTGHRLQATVTAVNTAAWNSVTTAGTAFVEASPLDDRHDRIIASYRQAFGDSPTSAEVAYWLTRGNLSVQQLVEFHRQGLRTDRTLASRAMRNAYVQAYGHAPNDNQARVGETTRDVDAIMRTGLTYDELVPVLGRRLAQQAFDKVYFWDPSLRRGNSSVVAAAGRNAELGVRRGEQTWTDVALSNDAIHGAARTSYQDGEQGVATREVCFGGIGPSCKGTGKFLSEASMVPWAATGELERFRPFVTEDGRQMGYIQLTTAVGSILHDGVCRTYLGAAWCKQDIGNGLRAELPLSKWLDKGTLEWDKATFDTFAARKWEAIYGPYPLEQIPEMLKGSSSITYSDDLRYVDQQLRYTEVHPGGLVLGFGNLLPPHRWGGVEVRSTTRLKAPSGTALDSSDKDFCASGRFASTGVSDWLTNAREFVHGAVFISQPKTFGRCA